MSVDFKPTYDPKNMKFRRLGKSGLQVSLFAYGGWLTVGGQVKGDPVKELIKTAWDLGIQTFDCAEVYSGGKSEEEMGRAFKELELNRDQLVVITKVYFGTGRKDPNQEGLSRKHIIQGVKASLRRMQLDYFDVVLAHRDDENVEMQEIVRAFNCLIDTGLIHYWGGSMWSAKRIEEAFAVAEKLGMAGPVADQPQHSMLWREKVDGELVPVFEKHGLGTTIWSPLKFGILTGKYNDGIPSGSRFSDLKDKVSEELEDYHSPEGQAEIAKVRKLSDLAGKLDTSMACLALAWAAKNQNVSTVILGATKPQQLIENVKALDVIDKLTPEIMQTIEDILKNDPRKH